MTVTYALRPTRTRMGKPALLASALTLAVACPFSSYGQEADSTAALEEIVVTATRRAEGIQSIPTSITALSGAELENRGISNFKNLDSSVSGLDLQQSEGFVSSAVYIRGVGTSGNSPAESSVGVVVDGIYQINPGFAFTEMLDVNRVEVLRGPQGTLFGKNTTAGLVAIETNDPNTREFSGRVQGVGGNLDAAELRGVVNVPLIEDKLAARFSGYTAEREGYTDNHFIGEDTRNVDRHGWRGKLLWNATDSLEFVLRAEQARQENRTDQSLVEYTPDIAANFGPLLPPISLGDSQQQASSVRDEVDRFTLTADWELPGHTFTSLSAYEETSGTINTDRDLTVLSSELGRAVTYISNTANTEVTTQEFQLSSNWEGPLNYIAGLFWQNEDLQSNTSLFFGGSDVPFIRPPSIRDVDSKAVFGNLTYDFNEQWDTSVGVRYTEDEKQGQNSQFEGVTTFDETTYSVKLRYTPVSGRMLYLAYDTGFKSGGVNREFSRCSSGGLCLAPDQALYDSETTDAVEIGVKSQWLDNRLRLNAAVFNQTYDDYQVTQSIAGESSITTNAAEVSSVGLEADFAWMVSEGFTFSGNLSYVQTEYDKYEDAPCVDFATPACVNGAQDLSGEQLDNAPELTYSLTGEYRAALPGFNNLDWFTRLDATYQDDHNLHLFLAEATEEDAYYLLDGRLGIESAGNWKVTGWVNNLADEEYRAWGQLIASEGLRLTPGLPRTYGLTVDWFF